MITVNEGYKHTHTHTYTHTHQIPCEASFNPHLKVGVTVIKPILQMRVLRHWDLKWLTQKNSASLWQSLPSQAVYIESLCS